MMPFHKNMTWKWTAVPRSLDDDKEWRGGDTGFPCGVRRFHQ